MSETGAWVHLKWRLQVLKGCAFLMAMSFLDMRDLWYKITWVGPYDSFAFNAGSRGTLLPTTLPVSVALPPSLDQPELASGWPSYLSRCESLTAFCSPGSTFFLNAMGTNCAVGVLNETKAIPQLVMTSNVRSDSMAWGACQLLYDHRKPAICQQHIVSNFLERYHMRPDPVPREWIAPVDSAAEAELLRFLELIAMSHPRYKVICTGGFAYDEPGRYYPKIFGCASPNLFRAEYVGVYATNIYRFQFDKAWLTAIDIVSFVGIQYKIRQNTINYFDMDEETITNPADGSTSTALSVTETTANNFVSTGLLYVLMIIVDFLLLLAQMYTGLELVTEWIIPVMRKQDEKQFEEELQERLGADAAAPRSGPEEVSFSKEEYTSFLSTSLYRSNIIVLFTVITQVISWGIIIPNSVIWTWSLSNSAKLQAFLGSLRLWTLILMGVNALWDIAVFFFEKQAYFFARATYVTSFEVIGIGAICAFSKRADVMAISETKFGIEHQRVNDVLSFAGYVAHGNTFNEDLDYSPNSKTELLNVMYMPLVAIVLYSILGVFLWLGVKMALYHILDTPAVSSRMFSLKKRMGVKDAAGNGNVSISGAMQQLRRKQLMNSAHMQDPLDRVYRRVTLEKTLDIPMRARSLVRATLSMQKTVNGEVVLRPPVHLDFGVLIRDRLVTARTGFRSTIRAKVQLPPPPVSRNTRIITMASINATEFMDMGELPSQRGSPEKHQLAKKNPHRKSFAAVHAVDE